MVAYTEEEVIGALKDIRLTKAPRMDGFPIIFFQQCLHIIGKDVSEYFLGVLNKGGILNP